MAKLTDLTIEIKADTKTYREAIEELKSSVEEIGKAMEVMADETEEALRAYALGTEARRIVGTWMGDGKVRLDIPEWYEDHPLDIENSLKETKMAKRKSSPFKTGRAKKRASSGSQFIGLKPDESETLVPLVGLDQLITAEMHEYWDIKPAIFHPCIGRDCPGCAAQNEPRFKAYLPVITKDKSVHIWPFTISVYNQLEELEDELLEVDENLAGYMLKFGRKGAMKATRYTVLGLGKRVDISAVEVPDFLPTLGPATIEDIKALLDENDVDYDEVGPTKEADAETDESEDVRETDEDGWDEV